MPCYVLKMDVSGYVDDFYVVSTDKEVFKRRFNGS